MMKTRILCLAVVLNLLWVAPGLSQEKYIIDPDLSKIIGSIKYSVVGKYYAEFDKFSGEFYFDPSNIEGSSVMLVIETSTIRSRFSALDNIVRSRQLLDVEKNPQTIFRSKAIKKTDKENEYLVTGDLTLHGVTREINFPFEAYGPFVGHCNIHVRAKGVWVINRKEFGIYWHPFLDKGGVLVGNHMTVEWEVTAFR